MYRTKGDALVNDVPNHHRATALPAAAASVVSAFGT